MNTSKACLTQDDLADLLAVVKPGDFFDIKFKVTQTQNTATQTLLFNREIKPGAVITDPILQQLVNQQQSIVAQYKKAVNERDDLKRQHEMKRTNSVLLQKKIFATSGFQGSSDEKESGFDLTTMLIIGLFFVVVGAYFKHSMS